MKSNLSILSSAATITAAVVLVGCGGGGGDSNSSAPPATLSSNQQQFESQILAPNSGSYLLHWNIASGPQVSGTNYAYSDYAVLAESPLTHGVQVSAQTAPHNLTTALAVVEPGPARILKDGAILVVPGVNQQTKVSYVGGDVRVDTLAADNATVAYSAIRSNYETVALTGKISATPDDFAHWHNSLFATPGILNADATYQSGASYVKFTQTNAGDRYLAFDCNASTTDANISACRTGVSLTDALTAGLSSSSDGTTYHLSDGSVTTVGGVPVWVAAAARPQSATLSSTVQYRIYFQLNGNVYTGALIKDGAVLGGSYYVSNPGGATVTDRLTFLPFNIRMNKAAHDSIAAAMQI